MGASKYAFYLRDLDTDTLIISTENVTTNSYTYNYLGSGKKYRWNVVAFDASGKGGWSADPVYFTTASNLTLPTRTISSLTQDELSLCGEGESCAGVTYSIIAIDNGNGLQATTDSVPAKEFVRGITHEAFLEGAGVVLGYGAIKGIEAGVSYATPYIAKIIGPNSALKAIGSKFVPGVGLLLIGISGYLVYTSTADMIPMCKDTSGKIYPDPDFYNLTSGTGWYYCGKLTVRIPVVAATTVFIAKVTAAQIKSYVLAQDVFAVSGATFAVDTYFTNSNKIIRGINKDFEAEVLRTGNYNEMNYYTLSDNSKIMFDAPVLLDKSGYYRKISPTIGGIYGLEKVRYSIEELPYLVKELERINMFDNTAVIKYIIDLDGKMTFTIASGNFYLPHPVLSFGKETLGAGEIKIVSGVKYLNNDSGHFKPSGVYLNKVADYLKLTGVNVVVKPL